MTNAVRAPPPCALLRAGRRGRHRLFHLGHPVSSCAMLRPLRAAIAGDTLSAMGEETSIVVGDRKELTYVLCQGAELEHGLLCEYLYAAFSLKSAPGPGLSGD